MMVRNHKLRSPKNSLEDRLRQQEESNRRRTELVAALQVKSPPIEKTEVAAASRHTRDGDAFLHSLGEIPFYRIGESFHRGLSDGYADLIRAAIRTMNTGEPEVLLWWPAHQPCLSAIASLLALGETSAVSKRKVKFRNSTDVVSDAPFGLRAVLYPYARTAHALAREIHVDRTALGKLHISHLLRSISGDEDPGLKDYHQVLSRVNSITGKGADGAAYSELQHPNLDELIPHGNPREGCGNTGHLLWHTKSKTDLRDHNGRTGAADDPSRAKFFLYCIRTNDSFDRELRAIGEPPELFLLDLSKAGRTRLGQDWVAIAKKAIEALRLRFPTTGILAITDDPWAYDAARFDLLGTKINPKRKQIRPSAALAVFSRTEAILSRSVEQAQDWEGADEIDIDGFAGQVVDAVSAVRAIGNKLRDRRNIQGAEAARNIVAKLRRAACLPGSLADLSSFLERETNDAIAADNMSSYRIGAEVATLTDPRSGASQIGTDELNVAISKATALLGASEKSTPMSSLIEEAVRPTLQSSSRSVFVFRSETIADFCGDQLGVKYQKLIDRLENGFIKFTSKQGFQDLGSLDPSARHQIKRAYIVAPTRQTILEILAQPWLPDHVGFLADSDTLAGAIRDANRLSSQLDKPELVRRLSVFASEADSRISQLGAHVVVLDRTVPPADDVEFPFGDVIDLAGPSDGGDHATVQLTMENGQKIIARPGTSLVVRDGSRSVSRFIEVPAKDVNRGDDLCVISPAFIEKARTLLNITAAAAEEIRDYHLAVTERFLQLPGSNETERLRALCDRMGDSGISTLRAKYWIDLQAEADKPIHEVVPHAPRDKKTFLLFTGALGIGQALAERFWAWAVIAQRSSRMRAGAAFHDAYRGILTDPHAVAAGNSERASDIRALRAAAEDYVSQVSAKEVFQP